MKLYLESVSEGNRSLAILGQLDSEVYAVARAANITPSLTTATIFERLRRGFGRSSMPWVARATLRGRRQHSGESVVDFQRHLRVLAKQAYSDDSFAALEDRILHNFVDSVANPDIRRKFMLDPPKTLKVALDIARDEEVVSAALSSTLGPEDSFWTPPPLLHRLRRPDQTRLASKQACPRHRRSSCSRTLNIVFCGLQIILPLGARLSFLLGTRRGIA
nr:unnamed protein product [Spirometra erinaceieuropaei]